MISTEMVVEKTNNTKVFQIKLLMIQDPLMKKVNETKDKNEVIENEVKVEEIKRK